MKMDSSCIVDAARALACRDGRAATNLKLVSIFIIFFNSVVGISLPVLLSKIFHGKPAYDKAILIIKCFAAGVILSTSLVHVLPDAFSALGNCQVASRHPWKDFPFSGLITLIGVLTALLVDLAATSHVDGQGIGHGHTGESKTVKSHDRYERIGANDQELPIYSNTKESAIEIAADIKGTESGEIGDRRLEEELKNAEELVKMKQRLVSQVLEIGIIFHSVIIGVTMGMSQNKCTIRPLVAALSFHQIFEGMGLGGCIAQAGFELKTTVYMCFMFSVTTPMGIGLGMVIFSLTGYDDSSPNALILEGLLGSLSSGILIYMALVDLIALDFFHSNLMASDSRLKKVCFIALILGSTSMSVLALWA